MRKALMLLAIAAVTLVAHGTSYAADDAQANKPKHVVAAGESLSTIATDSSLPSWMPIWNANTNLQNPDQINPGDELVIPNPDEQLAERPLPAGYGAPTPVAVTAAPAGSYRSAPRSAANYGTPANGLAARVCARESGCNYSTNTGNGYYGAYQYDVGTWGGYGGYARADLAPKEVQDAKFAETYARRGCSPWPNTCR